MFPRPANMPPPRTSVSLYAVQFLPHGADRAARRRIPSPRVRFRIAYPSGQIGLRQSINIATPYCAVCMIRATASDSRSQFDCSASNCFLPFADSR